MFSPENIQFLSTITLTGFFLVFLAGLAMAFNPRSLMIIPVIAGYLVGPVENRSFNRAVAFVLGMTVADVGLGVLFAYIGQGVEAIFGPRWDIVIGVVLIVLGLRWLNLLRFRTVGYEMEPKKPGSFGSAFLLGIPFSMSFCPFCTPILLSILSVAAATGKVWYSAALMVFFSLGRGLPLLVAGISTEALKRADLVQRYIPAFEKVGGAILIILGIYYLYSFSQYLTVL
jgi:cytochrome c-type biogenesis protein